MLDGYRRRRERVFAVRVQTERKRPMVSGEDLRSDIVAERAWEELSRALRDQ